MGIEPSNQWLSTILAMILSISMSSCGRDITGDHETFDVRIESGEYADFVDKFYKFSSEHRLTIIWFGWYSSEAPSSWYEKHEKSNFKIKAEMLSEENGYILASNAFDSAVVNVIISCGRGRKEWENILQDFIIQLNEDQRFGVTEVPIIECTSMGT